jgi:hypothetical protein
MKSHGSLLTPFASTFLVAFITLLRPSAAHAQQDGPRGYLLTPEGIHAAILANVYVDANQTPDQGLVVMDSDIKSFVSLPIYAHPLTIAGNVASVFAAQPIGTLDGSVSIGGTTISNTSTGLGDFAFGGMVGLVGMPALPMEEYLKYDPGFSLSAVLASSAPTGEYDEKDIFNLGQNRWLFRLSLPMSYSIGESFADPKLTTFELIPAVTFFTPNNDPFGAQKQTQEPLFQVEGHVTRNLTSKVWISADAAYFYGARSSTNGISDDNARMSFNLAGTIGATLTPAIQLKLSYGHSVVNNDYGFDGQGVRLMLIAAF